MCDDLQKCSSFLSTGLTKDVIWKQDIQHQNGSFQEKKINITQKNFSLSISSSPLVELSWYSKFSVLLYQVWYNKTWWVCGWVHDFLWSHEPKQISSANIENPDLLLLMHSQLFCSMCCVFSSKTKSRMSSAVQGVDLHICHASRQAEKCYPDRPNELAI